MKFIILALASAVTTSAFSQCDAWNIQDVFQEIKKKHPAIQIAKGQNEVIKETINKVDVLPNPKLDLSSMSGDEKDVVMGAISQKILIGGKRKSIVDVAKNRWELDSLEVGSLSEKKLIDAILVLHHFSHIDEESKIHQEAIDSFKSILKKWSKRKLSPTEQVEKETLLLAYNSFLLKLSELEAEKVELAKHLAFYASNDNCLDPAKYNGSFNFEYRPIGKDKSLDVLKAEKFLELSKSQLRYENSLAYPDLTIGPKFEIEKTDSDTNKSLGLFVSMDLPIFNRNSGGKDAALKKVSTASKNLKFKKREDKFDQKILKSKYLRYKKTLSKMMSDEKLDEKHKKLENLFKRGVIASSLIIEIHRQMIDFHESKYEFERDTLEALWNMYRLEGSFFKRKI